MKVIGKDRTSCDVCNPIDEILARLDALERRASAIVAKVQGLAPDGEGNVTLPTSSSDTDPLHGRIDAFAMSSEVKEAADDAHAYAASIADDVVVLQSDVEILTREVEALDPASVTALEQSVAALQQTVNQLSNLVGGFSAVIRDLEDQMPNKVDRTGDTMTGPLNVIDTVTGSRNTQAVNGTRLQNDLDNYATMLRTVNNQVFAGTKQSSDLQTFNVRPYIFQRVAATYNWFKVFEYANTNRRMIIMDVIWAHQSYNGGGCGRIILGAVPSNMFAKWLYRQSTASAFTADSVFIGNTTEGTTEIWVKGGYFVYCEIQRVIRGNVEDAIANTNNTYSGEGVADIDLSRFSIYAFGSD